MNSQSDSEVIARSLGDPEAFELLFDRHFDAVWSYGRKRLGDTLADDTANETFAQAFAGRKSYRPQTPSALPWLLGIATNICLRHWRTEAGRLRAFARTGTVDQVDLNEDGLLARVAAAAQSREIAEALTTLSQDDRETLLLAALGGLDNREIAAALQITPNAVGVRLHRIRARLAPLIENTATGDIR